MSLEYHTFTYNISEEGIAPREGCILGDILSNHENINTYFPTVDITISIDEFGISKISHVNGFNVEDPQ
jgi:hypothetical protein